MWQGGDTRELHGDGNLSDARWSPDGDQVLYVATQDSYSDLVLWDIDRGVTEQMTDYAPPLDLEPGSQQYVNRSSWALDPSWSSDSGRIAFVSDYEESGRMALWLIESPGADAVLAPEAAPTGVDIEGVSLSASGALAAYCVKSFDGVNHYTTVVLRDLSDGIEYPIGADGGVYDPSISPDEQWIAVTHRSPEGISDIWLLGRADGSATQLTFGEQAVAAAWSPDGNWLAYLRPSGDGFGLRVLPMGDGAATGTPISLGEWDGIDATSGLSWSFAE